MVSKKSIKKDIQEKESEEPKVTKLISEALPEKARRGGSHMKGSQETHSHEKMKETYVGKSQKTNTTDYKQIQAGEEREKEAYSVKEKPHTSIEEGEKVEKEADQGEPETGHLNDKAQEKSMEVTIRNAEEKYGQAKESGIAALDDVKESVFRGLGAATYYAAAQSLAATDTSLEKGKQVYNYTSEKVLDAGKTALDYTVSVGESAVHYLGEKAKEKAKELAAYKAVEAKDDVMSYVGEKAVEAKDKAINVGKDAVSYAGEKAIEAKDATLEAGKKALGVGSKVSSEASGDDDMLLSVDSLKERDFYLAKLQDIENVCQYYSFEIEKLPVVSAIQRILEAKNLVTLAEAQAMISQQQMQNDQLEVIAAEDKTESENQKRKNISSDEVDAAANAKLSPRQRISDASSDVQYCIGSPVMNTTSS